MAFADDKIAVPSFMKCGSGDQTRLININQVVNCFGQIVGVTAEYPAIFKLYRITVATWLRAYVGRWLRCYVVMWLRGYILTLKH